MGGRVHGIRNGGRLLRAWLAAALLMAVAAPAGAQMPGQGGMGGMGRQPGMSPAPETQNPPAADKPDAAAAKAFKAGLKSLAKARDYEAAADKKSGAREKMEDAYYRALDQFTEALSNKGDMVEAWNNVGYIHLRLGAYAESVDDYNHTLALQPDLSEAILHRAEAYLALDRLDDAKAAYMDLFNHVRPLADQLLPIMQKWLSDHRANANGVRTADIDAFDKWLQEREGIAKAAALSQ